MTNWWRRLTDRLRGGGAALENAPDTDERVSTEEVQAYARGLVHAGFLDRRTAEEQLVGYFEDSPGSPGPAEAKRIVGAIWDARLAEQRGWTDTGDYGRLAAAFAGLESTGITARMNFACCQSCGHAEIVDERATGARGYVFFHQQDSEGLADPETTVYLAYSYFDEHPDFDATLVPAAEEERTDQIRAQMMAMGERVEASVGAEVVAAMVAQGLPVTWDGTTSTRPAVTIRDWRKPLPV